MEGNQMKMREALEELKSEAEHGYEVFDYPVAGAPGERGIGHYVEADYIIDQANAALSEPPRNCDTGKDAKTLLDDYISIKRFSSDNQIRALYDLALPVIAWLLAPSAERKGECG